MIIGTASVDGLHLTVRQFRLQQRVEVVYPDGRTETRCEYKPDGSLEDLAVRLVREWAEDLRLRKKPKLFPRCEAAKVIDHAISGAPIAEDFESKFTVLRQRSVSGRLR